MPVGLILEIISRDVGFPAVPESFDERVTRVFPVIYIFLIVPFLPLLYLLIRRIFRKTVLAKRQRTQMEELKLEADEAVKSGKYVSAAVIYDSHFKDMPKAAEFYEMGGDYLKAARVREDLGEEEKARELYDKAGEVEKTAELSERLGLYEEAARLYKQCGKPFESAQCLERAGPGRMLAAARAYREAGYYRKASELLEQTGMPSEACQMFEITLREKELCEGALDDYFSYAVLLEKAGRAGEAKELFGRIASVSPDYLKTRRPDYKEETGPAPQPVEPAVTGRSLRELMDRTGTFEPREALKLWVRILKNLKEKTEEGFFRAGLSPETIIIDGDVLSIHSSPVAGTEQEDLRSMGLILYEMLLGRPFKSGDVSGAELIKPAWLRQIAVGCIEGEYKSADDVFQALKKAGGSG
jgi:tetratricopeptide (TPR) repeat protein